MVLLTRVYIYATIRPETPYIGLLYYRYPYIWYVRMRFLAFSIWQVLWSGV